ncbi:hypothetical protein B0H67DRAFT_51644 [Lasiosphaeris hirsuta]|uniref:Uncharacterized protein n=1 Tax=Lasiosphaeris hirsuta TaxID=260670 RepID=A0AA40E777_9PEZI|nr:hypothetical protein B0H67DRAFT_51644 [Lasiosphaeris hirsuta]
MLSPSSRACLSTPPPSLRQPASLAHTSEGLPHQPRPRAGLETMPPPIKTGSRSSSTCLCHNCSLPRAMMDNTLVRAKPGPRVYKVGRPCKSYCKSALSTDVRALKHRRQEDRQKMMGRAPQP